MNRHKILFTVPKLFNKERPTNKGKMKGIETTKQDFLYSTKKNKKFNKKCACTRTYYARKGFLVLLFMEESMREKTIEQKLVKTVKSMGGICPKWVAPGFDGVPDRIVLLPRGKIGFVEVKAPGEKPRPLQKARHGMLKRLGFLVFILDGEEQIGGILDAIRST